LEEARYAVTAATLEGELDGKRLIFEAKGRRLIFPGWRVIVDGDQSDEDGETELNNPIPGLREGGQVAPASGKVLSKKTRPPARFTEAALVKKLEELGIGRPSTYAAILDNLIKRGYVAIEKRQLAPTALGESLVNALSGKFAFLDSGFTRELEAKLDGIAEGQADYRQVVSSAHDILQSELQKFIKANGHICPECGKPLRRLAKAAAGGKKAYDFWACSGYPECKASFLNKDGRPAERQVKKEPVPLSEHKCPDCGKALRHMVREGAGGYDFWGCSGYPDCKSTFKDDGGQPGEKNQPKAKPGSGFKCPKCKKPLYRRQGVSQKTGKAYDFYGCSDRACDAVYYPGADGKPDFKPRGK
jgi:DNA topoisomerase-1